MPEDNRDEQMSLLRESVVEFVRRNADMKRLRQQREQLPGTNPGLLQDMTQMGWFGILVPAAQGGLGLGHGEMAVVLEELGKGLLAEPLVACAVLAGRVLAQCPAEGKGGALRSELLAALAQGSQLPVLAFQEGLGALEPQAITTVAEPHGDGVSLSGSKRFVAGAALASGFVVTARSAAGLGLYWVPLGTPGLRLGHEWRADGSPSGVLDMAQVQVPARAVLMPAGSQTEGLITQALDEAAVMAAAEMLGVMSAALQMALAYLRTRVQFGKPIGSFQALQHKAADLYVQQELSRAVLAEAVKVLETGGDAQRRALVASRCKSRCSDAGLRVTREVIQLHGAIGFTDEYDAGLYLKRALVLSAWLGNASAHRRRFAALSDADLAV